MRLRVRPSAIAIVAGLALGAVEPVSAGRLEIEVESRWLGAWVVTRTESYSDCGGLYTNNRVNGTLVRSSGRVAFEAGELAKVDKIDVNRSRVDVLLSVAEPVLLESSEGPFTLYRETSCRVELEVEVPRDVVKSRDAAAIDEALSRAMESHGSWDAATASVAYNGRVRADFPEDYELTLAALAVWRAERTNEAVQAGLDVAAEIAGRLADRIDGDPDYVAGFAAAVERTRVELRSECGALVAANPVIEPRFRRDMTPAERRRLRGEADGAALVTALAMLRGLPGCFVPVPDAGESIELAASD